MASQDVLKFALKSFWDGKSSTEDLLTVTADIRSSIWKQMAERGIKYIPSNTFSYYDQVLDTTIMLGAVPPRYNWNGGEIGFDTYFSMARGNTSVHAMEMTKWFDTNYHFIVPELGPEVQFSYASHKAVNEYKEAKALGVDTVPVFVGPVSYLLLAKPAKGVEKTVDLLSLLDKILPIYKEVIAELKAAGATWIQFDEATLVKDPEAHQLTAFTKAYKELQSACSGVNVLFATYFADIPADAFKILTTFPGVAGYTFDLVRGAQTLDLIKTSFPSGKFVDGRNIWANDLAGSVDVLKSLESVDLVNETEIKSLLACTAQKAVELVASAQKAVELVASAQKFLELGASALENIVGKDKLVVSTSSSQQHTAVDLVNKTEIKSWLAFTAQKFVELVASAQKVVELVAFAQKVFELGASARKYHEVKPALENMVTAAKKLDATLTGAK